MSIDVKTLIPGTEDIVIDSEKAKPDYIASDADVRDASESLITKNNQAYKALANVTIMRRESP